METHDTQGGKAGVRGVALQRALDRPRHPNAVLLFPSNARLPANWHVPWAQAGWSVTTCGGPEDIPEAIVRPGALALIASPWPSAGDASTTDAIADGLQGVVAALGIGNEDAQVPAVSGGTLRRGDFLSHLSAVMRAPGSDCYVLLAIRVDQLAQLASRFNAMTIFALEEQIFARLTAALNKQDTSTIWMEFGFGILVQRENHAQVEALAEDIRARISEEAFPVADGPVRITVSIGMALPPRDHTAERADRWFASAHAAQAMAHRHGGNRCEGVLTRAYEPIPAERVLIIREWIEEAKTGSNLMVEFQPVLPLHPATEGVYAVHAKLRDYRAPLGGVYRSEFRRLASESGALVIIDRMTLFRAFEALEQERVRDRPTRLLVPVDIATLEGVPWQWLEAELRRRKSLTGRLILELEASDALREPDNIERIDRVRGLGVHVCLSDPSGTLQNVRMWSALPADLLRLPLSAVDTVPPEAFLRDLSPWRGQGRELIVDEVEAASDMACFVGLGVDYLCGESLAAIGPRLDFEFA